MMVHSSSSRNDMGGVKFADCVREFNMQAEELISEAAKRGVNSAGKPLIGCISSVPAGSGGASDVSKKRKVVQENMDDGNSKEPKLVQEDNFMDVSTELSRLREECIRLRAENTTLRQTICSMSRPKIADSATQT